MTTELSRIPRPQADRFSGKKKLFLVPNYVLPPGAPEDGRELVARYWSEVRDSVSSLERSLGAVSRVYHELVCVDGEDGLAQIEAMNPNGCPFIRAMCQSSASLYALEDAELVAEHTDWQRVLSLGPASQKVFSMALDGYQTTLAARFEAIGERIADEIEEGESAALFIREDHRIQFSGGVQVFFVAPPSLDALKRWLDGFFAQPASGE